MRWIFFDRFPEERIAILEVFLGLIQPLIRIEVWLQLLAITEIRLKQQNLVKKSMPIRPWQPKVLTIFKQYRSSISILPGFKSRCTMFRPCMNSRVETI